jgi:SAM-dependent methyltransferase
MAEQHTAYTFGVFCDDLIIWRARPSDVLVENAADRWLIRLVFENQIAAACLRDQVLQELHDFDETPLVATLVIEQDGSASCHVQTNPRTPRRTSPLEQGQSPPPTSADRHVEIPLRAPGRTLLGEELRQLLLLATPAADARVEFSIQGGRSLAHGEFRCQRLDVLERETMSTSDHEQFPLVKQPESLQQPMGAYSDSVLDEEIWGHAPKYLESCDRRSSGQAPEMDCVRQLVEILRSRVAPGSTLLDAGCGPGHYYISLRELDFEYYGIDSFPEGIRIGQRNLREFGLHASRLQVRRVESLTRAEQYDVIVAFNLLAYLPDFRLPLERMTQSCRNLLVIRSGFGNETTIRWIPDLLLEDGFQDLRFYQNIYSRDVVQTFLEERGFEVDFLPDDRQIKVWGGRPEIVAGIEIPYEILVARRQ